MPTDRREILKRYVRKRLEADVCPGGVPIRGKQAAVSRATHTSTAHVSNIISQGRSFGDEFMHALAANWWKIPFSELERLAMADAGVRMLPRAEPTLGPVLRSHPRWDELVAQAIRDEPTIPPQFFDAAGDAGLGPSGVPEALTPSDISAIARVLANQAARRPLPPVDPPSLRGVETHKRRAK